jgi:hypothetical protein
MKPKLGKGNSPALQYKTRHNTLRDIYALKAGFTDKRKQSGVSVKLCAACGSLHVP